MIAQVMNLVLFGGSTDLFSILRLSTAMFAAWYFGSKGKLPAVVAVACMALFWLHPVGRAAPLYALFWIIPVAAKFAGDNLVIRSLGATFTAHAVGSVVFIYTIPTLPSLWVMLIPVVFMERFVFTAGIAMSCVAVNTILDVVSERINLKALNIDRRYALVRLLEEL